MFLCFPLQRKTGGNKVSDEKVIMDIEDYHEILNKIVSTKRLVDANDMIGVEGGLISIEDDLLEKAEPYDHKQSVRI